MIDPSTSTRADRLAFDTGATAALSCAVPVEHPVNIVYGNQPYAVMMATPADIEDFAVGFSLTEGIIDAPEEIRGIAIEETPAGIVATLTLTPDRFRRHLARTRNTSGRTGCGICGIESLDMLPQATAPVGEAPLVPAEALASAIRSLEAHQPLNDLTRAVHAAAWCSLDGSILAVREDVGRHNALDKLIGALLRGAVSPLSGFLLITSRCSFEMVEKAARFGARTLVAVSAPTSLALARAQALGIALVAVARRDSALVFSGPLPVSPRSRSVA